MDCVLIHLKNKHYTKNHFSIFRNKENISIYDQIAMISRIENQKENLLKYITHLCMAMYLRR